MRKSINELIEEIRKLKRELNAVILAHNYQPQEVQEIADFVGDSLELSIQAMSTDAKVILFAGVDFMAEQAKILNPEKIVLIPDKQARCHMANMLTVDQIRKFRKRHPEVPLVLYVNSLAECKAYADYVCTSANAADVVKAIDAEVVALGPDANLAAYAEWRTGKRVLPVPECGHCYVHKLFRPDAVRELVDELRSRGENVVFIAHPECDMDVLKIADYVGSTSQMLKFVKNLPSNITVVYATEVDMGVRFRKERPDIKFVPANPWAYCIYMKQHTLEKIVRALREKRHVVELDHAVMKKAREAIIRTFELLGIVDKLPRR